MRVPQVALFYLGVLTLRNRGMESFSCPLRISSFCLPLLPYFLLGQPRRKLTRSKCIQRAKAVDEFERRQAPLAIEPAEKITGGAIPLLHIAARTAGHKVAVGIAPEAHLWHNVIEAANQRRKSAQAIETESAFSIMDGLAQSLGRQEVRLEVDAVRNGPTALAGGLNFAGQPYLDHVAGIVAFDQTQSAMRDKTAYGTPGGVGRHASTAGEPGEGEVQQGLAFETAVPQEMRIDPALRDGQAQPRNEQVIELFPD